MRHTLSILVKNEAGVLSSISGLFSGRGYNIESLTVAPTIDNAFSRITIVTTGDKTGAIGTLLLTKRYVRLMDRITTTELIAMIVGAALAVLCSLGGVNIVPSVILALWQGAWCGVVWFLSRRTLITQNTDKG